MGLQYYIEDNRQVIINDKHGIYGNDIRKGFNLYHGATKPTLINDLWTVDYSEPKWHDVIGYDKHKILFASFPEPVATTLEYMEFAQLKEGSVVLDLGAYSGLSAILFKEKVGETGVVIGVEADVQNIETCKQNTEIYKRLTGQYIHMIYGAVWNHNQGISFSSEGNMGSSAIELVGYNRGNEELIPTFTLSDIADVCNLNKVDFIKCDIEGAEKYIFEDEEFFKKYRPRIIIEPHGGEELFEKIFKDLNKHGYLSRVVAQVGVDVPLIECVPL